MKKIKLKPDFIAKCKEQKKIKEEYQNFKLDKFLISYNGNKYLETKKFLKNELNTNYDIIAEPFCGIFGFSRYFYEINYLDFKGEFWLNDINNELIKLLNEIKTTPLDLIQDIQNFVKDFKTDKDLTDYIHKHPSELGFKIMRIFRGSTYRLLMLKSGNSKINNFLSCLKNYKLFFDKVKFFNLPYHEFMNLLAENKKILVFFDPPYFNSNNREYQNKIHINETEHHKDRYDDGTEIYLDIFKYFEENKFNCLFVMNKIAIINHIFCKYNFNEYRGYYGNNTTKGKTIKWHMFYKNY
jgi:site-specific DNA-adenine methylase